MSGYIKLYRSVCDNPMWEDEPFTKSQAWIDLLLNANYVERKIMIRGQSLIVKRGQIAWSEVTMTARWKWSRNKVRRFLKRLSDEGMIVQQAEHLTSLITICKYEEYQASDTADETTNGTPDETAGETSDGTQHKKVNKGKKEKKERKAKAETLLPDDFVVTEQMAQWYAEQGFSLDITSTTAKWKDSMTAKKFTYADWTAAWRNGMRKAQEWHNERMAQQGGQVVPFNNGQPRPRKMLPKVGAA